MRIFSQYIFFLLLLVCTNASAQVPRGTPTEAYPSGSASLVCELETKKVSYGEPVRVHLEGTRLATKIDYRVITGSQSVEVSGSFSRSAAVSQSSNATSVMVDTSGFRPGSYRLIATAIADGKTTSCEVNFSVFYATAARPTENYQRVKLFFATDRATGETQGDVQTFTSSRAENGSLKFGTAEVSIPRDHRMGELERPSLLRLEFREDPEKHIVLLKATTLNEDVFLKELQARINSDPQKEVLIFIHGYSVTFEEAARRLGQITYDLGFAGAPILYSWPSQGTIFGYTADEATIEWVIPHFETFYTSWLNRQERALCT